MADRVTAKAEADKGFEPHPEGPFVLQCVDVVDYGETVNEWQGKIKIAHKVGLFFQSGLRNEQDQPFTVACEFTLSMFEKANLRKFLESWRGKSYTEEQALAGVPIDKLEGHWGYATVEHKISGKGRAYAVIVSIMPVPQGFTLPTIPKYERPEYVTKRKAEYAAELAKHQAIEAANMPRTAVEGAPNRDTSFDDFPEALDGVDDDLPF